MTASVDRQTPVLLWTQQKARTKMAKMADTLCTDAVLLNDCILCDAEAKAQREGRKAWSVSIGGQPLCSDCNYFIMMERMQ